MAENKSGAQHLTSLDFDISGILETLRQADEQTQQMGIEIGKNFSKSFQEGLNSISKESNAAQIDLIDEKSIKNATDGIESINNSYGKLSKTITTLNASGQATSKRITYVDENGVQTVLKYNSALEQTGQTITQNYSKQQAQQKKLESQLQTLIEKQTKFNNLVSSQKSSTENKRIISENQELINSAEKLKQEVQNQSVSYESATKQLEDYRSEANRLGNEFDTLGTKGESFLKKVADKAQWLGAFYVVNELIQGFKQSITVIKETEDAVVDLQRVLNDDSLSKNKMSDELYDVAYEYGRTFAEVAEVSTAFAQAGYDWADTMELTRGTMLALNTAELDVTESTQGLIAIMSQWNLTAEDYADVVDKINITADNFAVNSENIVAALQRASSSAKNANISLEETIGIITALAEATGRSGENIGTALNSLIIYTSKASALETFAQNGSDAMKQVVEEYKQGAVSIYDVWVQLSEELGNLTVAQQEALFNSKEYQEFADELESQAEEFTTQVNEIYGAAGTYRQNYFIALLNDMSTAQEAVEGMSDAEGYSVKENEKYMESLTANWNQLKDTLAELAVQLGQAGLLDLLKSLTQLGVAIATITKNLGGILPVLTAVGGVVLSLKAENISKNVIEIGNGLKSIPTRLKAIVTGTTAVTTSTNAAATAENAAAAGAAAWQAAFGWIGLVATAISGLVMVFSGFKSANDAAKQSALDSADANLQEAQAINELKAEYAEIVNYSGDVSEKTEKLAEFKKKLIAQYGLEKEAVEQLNGARQEEINFLDEEYRKNITKAWVDVQDQYEKAVSTMQDSSKNLVLGWDTLSIDETTLNTLKEYLNVVESVDESGNVYARSFEFPTESLEEQRDILADIIAEGKVNNDILYWAKIRYDQINEKIESVSDAYTKGNEVASQFFFTQENTLKAIEAINEATDENKQKELYESLIESVYETNYGLEAQKEIISIIEEMFPQFVDTAEDAGEAVVQSFSVAAEEIESLKESISDLSSEVDSFQSAYDAVNSAIEEYNENGYLSVDTLQQLISMGAEYWDMLNFTANGIELNNQAAGRFINTQQENIDKMIQYEAATEIARIANEYLSGSVDTANSSMQNSSGATDTMANGIYNVTQQAINGAISIAEFNNQINQLTGAGTQLNNTTLNQMYNEMNAVVRNAQSLRSALSGISSGTQEWTNASNAASNAAKSASDSQKKALEEQKQAVKDRYDAEIEALKKVEQENERIRKEEEYYRNRQESIADIEKASTRSGVEYREQEAEARQKLEDLDREWQEQLEDWSIDDRISELEALRDAEIAAIDAQIDAIQSKSSSAAGGAIKTASNANTTMLDNYKNQFVTPVFDQTKLAFLDIEEQWKEMLGHMNVYTDDAINEMRKNFSNNLFKYMLQNVGKLPTIGVISPQSATTSGIYGTIQNSSSVVNNNTQNANIFASVYGTNSANSLTKSIFNFPGT